MRTRTKAWTAIVMAGLALEGWALHVLSASPARWRPAMIVRDDPVAHTLYEVMLKEIREADGLSYTGVCSGPDERTSTYKVWLKKPNALRVEVTNGPSSKGTTVVCDGGNLWLYWEGDRPFLRVDDANTYEQTQSNVYVQKSAKAGEASISPTRSPCSGSPGMTSSWTRASSTAMPIPWGPLSTGSGPGAWIVSGTKTAR